MKASSSALICFGLFEFNPQASELRKQGLKIKLGPQPCKVLALLLEHPGQSRTREELRQRLWPADTFVDFEHGLNKAIHALREALGDSARSPRYIETVAGNGYRFIPIPQKPRAPAVRPRNGRKIESLAVLPLASEPDLEMEFLNKSIIERVIDSISRTSRVRVLAYNTVRCYRDKNLDPRTLGQDLLAHAVAAGEIVRRNDELRLHMELIDVDDGTQLWGAQFKEPYSDALAHPEKLAGKICAQLRPMLAADIRGRIKERPEHAA